MHSWKVWGRKNAHNERNMQKYIKYLKKNIVQVTWITLYMYIYFVLCMYTYVKATKIVIVWIMSTINMSSIVWNCKNSNACENVEKSFSWLDLFVTLKIKDLLKLVVGSFWSLFHWILKKSGHFKFQYLTFKFSCSRFGKKWWKKRIVQRVSLRWENFNLRDIGESSREKDFFFKRFLQTSELSQ